MRNLDTKFIKRKINYKKLEEYGFEKFNSTYLYKKNILDDAFEVNVMISEKEKYSKVIDLFDNTEYALVDVETAAGEFVGTIRQEYERVIDDIISNCTEQEIFKSKQTKDLIEYINKKYDDKLEFLWKKFDDNAIWRNKNNSKWYGVLMTITEDKLGINSNKRVEVIDLRYQKDSTSQVVDNENIFPGYHMNKRSWITVVLNGKLDNITLFELVDNSYDLSGGNTQGNKQSDLANKVYEYLTLIPKGKVVTYKQVAEYLGNKGLARVVGNILHKNPDGDKYPCYKVLSSDGKLAECFVFGGKSIQKERLEKDGIEVKDGKVDLNRYQWK